MSYSVHCIIFMKFQLALQSVVRILLGNVCFHFPTVVRLIMVVQLIQMIQLNDGALHMSIEMATI